MVIIFCLEMELTKVKMVKLHVIFILKRNLHASIFKALCYMYVSVFCCRHVVPSQGKGKSVLIRSNSARVFF